MGFRATLNFRKFKVALNRIALNVSLNLSIYYSFRHVLNQQHRNTITLQNTPDNRNSQKSSEHRI